MHHRLKTKFSWAKMMRKLFIIGLVLACGWLVNFGWFKPFSLTLFLERYFLEYGRVHPEFLSTYGRYGFFNLGQHHDKLNGADAEATEEYRKNFYFNLEMLDSYPLRDLSKKEQMYSNAVREFVEKGIYDLQLIDTLQPVLDYHNGRHVAVPLFLSTVHQIKGLQDAKNYISRLKQFAEQLNKTALELDAASLKNRLPSKIVIEKVIEQLELTISRGLSNSLIYIDFRNKLIIDDDTRIQKDATSEFLYTFQMVFHDELMPSYHKLLDMCKQVLPEAPEEIGALNVMPDLPEQGEYYYQLLLNKHMTKNVSRIEDEVEFIYQDIEQTQAQIIALLQDMGYQDASPANMGQTLNVLLLSPDYHYGQSDRRKLAPTSRIEELKEEAKEFSKDMSPFSSDAQIYLAVLDDFYEPYSRRHLYVDGTLDDSRKPYFYFDPNTGFPMSKFALPVMVCAEMYPGHHYQKTIQQHNTSLPTLLRALSFTAYDEGWKIYAVDWMYEKGFFKTDWEKLAALQYRLLIARKAIADVEIHHYGQDLKTVIDGLSHETGITPKEAETEAWTILATPAYSVAYIEGLRNIKDMKTQCQNLLGEKFDEREFHGAVLGNGSLPMMVLRTQVLSWLNQQLAAQGKEQLLTWDAQPIF